MKPFKGLLLIATITSLVGFSSGWASADGDELDDRVKGMVANNGSGTLIVRAQGLESSDGNLRFVLFNSKKNFLKSPTRAEIIEIEDRQGTWIIDDLPYGVYALLVHHDVDASGVMERHWYGKPKEPTGASNDAPSKFGPPKFKDARFPFESPTLTITVTVK
jgi:uncharacterized protein (DUF2141 family)